jgi:hypothetical protein
MLTEEAVFYEPSWVMRSELVRMALTQVGAQMAPVYFDLPQQRAVQPFYVSPWQCEDHGFLNGRSEGPLRGDFFCLPFGKADPGDGAPAHGKTASARWSFGSYRSHDGIQEFSIQLNDALHSACVKREFFLRDGETAIYDRTTISDLTGAYTMGHHAVLRVPEREPGLLVSTSKLGFGMTYQESFADQANGEYQSLAIGAEFDDLSSVPSIFKGFPNIDCSRYPARRGFTDLLQIGIEAERGQPAWSAAVNCEEGYLWFSLRDPALLPSTILWIENGGRHRPPWSGRNCCLGIEDVCSLFDTGSKVSSTLNAFSERGFKTAHQFKKERPEVIPYIQGVASAPSGFSHVHAVRCEQNRVTFADAAGREASARLQAGFVYGEPL